MEPMDHDRWMHRIESALQELKKAPRCPREAPDDPAAVSDGASTPPSSNEG